MLLFIKKKKNDEGSSMPKLAFENNDEDVSLQTRISAKYLRKIIENFTTAQMKALDEMGFGNLKLISTLILHQLL